MKMNCSENVKISIIIPVYNAGRSILRCLKSVARQSFTDYEVIVLDDGSKDGSGELAGKYIARDEVLSSRARVISKENSGVADTRNYGITLAKGEYLSFIDQDDFIAKDYLEKYYAAACSGGADAKLVDIVVGGYERVASDGRIITRVTVKSSADIVTIKANAFKKSKVKTLKLNSKKTIINKNAFNKTKTKNVKIYVNGKLTVKKGAFKGLNSKAKIIVSKKAYKSVLAKAGTIHRDAVEQRVINDVLSGTPKFQGKSAHKAGIIDAPADADGWPQYATVEPVADNDHDGMADEWERVHGLNPSDSSDRNNVISKYGYTALEVYLNSLMGE